jgi:hypothetical protein
MLACTPGPQADGPAPRQQASEQPAPSPEPSLSPPEPEQIRFEGNIVRLPEGLRREMRGTTWKPGCPVSLDDLRLLRFTYRDFDGEVRRGPMVVNEEVAEDVLSVFRRLFRARFPIKHVALTREFVPEEFEPRISSPRSVTAAFNCRPVEGGGRWSEHAYGTAIDINPVQNPYRRGDVVRTCADIEASRRDLGFEPKTPIEEGLPRFVAWYRDYHGL